MIKAGDYMLVRFDPEEMAAAEAEEAAEEPKTEEAEAEKAE